MLTRWDELIAEYGKISPQVGQAQFITDWTGFSEKCTRRVLGHLLTQPVFSSDEWDLKAQARNAGVSFDEYAVAMIPYMRMSVERSEARLREIKARIDSGDDPRFSDEELEQSKKWKAFVETIARLSGEETEVVYQIWDAVAAFKTRQQEILHELIRLTPRGVKGAVIEFFLNKAGTAQIGEHLLRCDTDFIPPLSGRVEINDYAQKIANKATRFEAWSEDTLVGLVAAYCYELEKHIAFITNVSVLKEWSGKGIAGDLLKWCVEHVKAMGMRQVNLKVAIDNTLAIRLYEQNGFVARKLDAPFTTMNLCLKSEEEYSQQA